MSWNEALEDGIPVTADKSAFNWYHPPCHICGAPVKSWSYIRGTRYTCKDCRVELVKQSREEGSLLHLTKKQRKMEIAIKRISKITDIQPYAYAICLVKKNLERRGWYQSTEEIMVALELIRQGVKANHQVRVFEYRVDFVLPEIKIALEIDRKPYHGKEKLESQSIRDNVITWRLGEDWQMIRITTDNINRNITKLIPAIQSVLTKRRSIERIV